MDLTDVVEANKGAIYPDALNSVLYKDRYWGAPWAMTVANLMYYNAGVLAEHGVDPATLTTWSAFTDACQTFQDAGVTPVLIGAKKRLARRPLGAASLHQNLRRQRLGRPLPARPLCRT